MAKEDLSIFERTEIQMEYVVPLIRDLQKVLGEQTMNDALAEVIERRRVDAKKAGAAAEPNLSAMAASIDQYASGGGDLDYEILASDDERVEMNVHGCGYARMMERLGGRDIGHLLICNHDFPMADAGGLELTRTQTRMQGGEYCDFRYRKANR